MVRNIAMLVLCIVVAGAMVATLKVFLRKLVKIEKDMWDARAREVSKAKKKSHAG